MFVLQAAPAALHPLEAPLSLADRDFFSEAPPPLVRPPREQVRGLSSAYGRKRDAVYHVVLPVPSVVVLFPPTASQQRRANATRAVWADSTREMNAQLGYAFASASWARLGADSDVGSTCTVQQTSGLERLRLLGRQGAWRSIIERSRQVSSAQSREPASSLPDLCSTGETN